VTPLRLAAYAIIALAAMAAAWALMLKAGVNAFPTDSFLAHSLRHARDGNVTLMLAGVAVADAVAVAVVTRWPQPRLASWGLVIALCGAALLVLTIGTDLRSTADLDGEIYPQPMFWYHVVGVLLDATLGCLVVGWGLWLGAIVMAWRRRRVI
jgi:hypothetical protein